MKLARELGLKIGEANCFVVCGEIFIISFEFKKAEEYFREAIEILTGLDEGKYLAQVYFAYAKMLKKYAAVRPGLDPSAAEYFKRARAIYLKIKLDHKIKEIDIQLNQQV